MDLKLSVLLNMIDKVSAPLKGVTGNSTAASKALRETRQRLKELQKAQDELKGFRDLKRGIKESGQAFRATSQRVVQLRQAIAATENPTRKATLELAKAEKQAARLKQAHMRNLRTLRSMRDVMDAAGINTRRLAESERMLAADVAGANAKLTTQQERLSAITRQQEKMAAARQRFERGSAAAAHLSMSGAAAWATGSHVLGALAPTVTAAKDWQTQTAQLRAMGVGDAMMADASKFARAQDIMGTSATDTLKLLKESYGVLRDMHEAEAITPYLARMKFGIETVMAQGGHGEGHGEHAEAMFMDLLKVAELRGAAKNPESLKRVLDFATQSYVASGGLVKPDDLLNMIKTGGIAAKQLDNQSFFFGLLHTMQEMGGHRAGTGLATAYQNWAAGRSTQQSAEELRQLGLLNPNAIQYGKTGHLKKMLPDALKEGDLYRSNPFEYLMTRVVPKLNPDGKLNDMQVVTKINALFSGRKGGDLFASLYKERANIAKHLAAAPRAFGVEGLYNQAKGTASGQEAELLARKADLYRELGQRLLPLYVSGLSKLAAVLRSLNGFAKSHPLLAKGIVIIGAAIGALMMAAGGLMVALGGLLGHVALLRLMLSLSGATMGRTLSILSTLARFIGTGAMGALRMLGGGFGLVLRGLMALGSFLLANPIVLVIAAIAGAAYLIYRNWGAVSAFLGRLWNDIKTIFRGAYEVVAGLLTGDWSRLTQGWTTMWTGVGSFWRDLWEGIKATGSAALGWIETKLGAIRGVIDKLTAAWHKLRGDTAPVVGAPIEWITGDDPEKARKVADAIGRTPLPGNTPSASGPSAINTPAPVSAQSGKAVVVQGDQVTMQVDARGTHPDEVKRQVKQALDEHERDKRVRMRSAFAD